MPPKRLKSLKTIQHTMVTGLLVLAPLAVTTLIVFTIYKWVDDHSPFEFRGGSLLAVVVVLLIIYVVGWVSRTALGSLVSLFSDVIIKVPGVGMIYSYVRDMVQALGGNDNRFRQPVWVYPYPRSKMRMIGFITREDLSVLGLKGDVAVFLALAYNISGILVILPRNQVKPLKTKSKDLLAFVATGGLAGGHEPKAGENDD
jgi:uncharacterized membrane protein